MTHYARSIFRRRIARWCGHERFAAAEDTAILPRQSSAHRRLIVMSSTSTVHFRFHHMIYVLRAYVPALRARRRRLRKGNCFRRESLPRQQDASNIKPKARPRRAYYQASPPVGRLSSASLDISSPGSAAHAERAARLAIAK